MTHDTFWQVETDCGTESVPAGICDASGLADYLEGEQLEPAESVTGFFARLSAPGYMDRTPWCGPFGTEAEAADYLEETYGE